MGGRALCGCPPAAGANAQDIQPTLAALRRSGIRAILDYAAEDDVADEKSDELAVSREEPHKTGGWGRAHRVGRGWGRGRPGGLRLRPAACTPR